MPKHDLSGTASPDCLPTDRHIWQSQNVPDVSCLGMVRRGAMCRFSAELRSGGHSSVATVAINRSIQPQNNTANDSFWNDSDSDNSSRWCFFSQPVFWSVWASFGDFDP